MNNEFMKKVLMHKKALIIGGVVLGLGAVAYFILRPKNSPVVTNKAFGDGNPNGAGTLSQPQTQDPVTGAFTTSGLNFKQMADDIFNALSGYTTDTSSVLNNFSLLQSDSDFDALVKAYGTRTVSTGLGNIFDADYTGNLTGALIRFLSTSDISTLNAQDSKVGITRQI